MIMIEGSGETDDLIMRNYPNKMYMDIRQRYFLMYGAGVYVHITRQARNEILHLEFDPKFAIEMPFEECRKIFKQSFGVGNRRYDLNIDIELQKLVLGKRDNNSVFTYTKKIFEYDVPDFSKTERMKLYDELVPIIDRMKFDGI